MGYAPHGLVHSVYNMDSTISVAANYASEGNFKNIWEEIALSHDRKHWRQAYYAAFTSEQRKKVRETENWPPSKFESKKIISSDSSDSDDVKDSDDVFKESDDEEDIDDFFSDQDED